MNLKNKIILVTVLALIFLMPILLSDVTVKAVVQNPDVYISETIGEPISADPGFQYDSLSLELLHNVYEQLIFFDFTEAGKFIGIIADSWWGELCDVTDPITGLNYQQKWTFHIRSGVHFHDVPESDWAGEGLEVTPEDVEYSFERNMVVDSSTSGELLIYNPLLHVYYANMSDELWGRKIDFAVQRNDTERTVTFYLLTPSEPFLQIIAQPYGAIMNKAWMLDTRILGHEKNWPGTWPDWTQPNSPENNYTAWHEYHDPPTSPIEVVDCSSPGSHLDYMLGTGPYMFKYWNKGDGGDYFLMKNANYWRGWSGKHVGNFQSKYIGSRETRRDHFLAGQADTVFVPLAVISQVQGQPGIRGMKDFPLLYCLGMFLCGNISSTSPYIGTIPPDGEFNGIGFPTNGFQDEKLRKAFRALFPYTQFLHDMYLDEAIQPATCVVPGLAYHDPSIPKPQYNMTLAIKLLKEAWGGSEESPGPVWTNGFTMSFVYAEGAEPRFYWAQLLKGEFDYINANYGTHFNVTVTGVAWSNYSILWKSQKLPLFLVAWGADYPDAHNLVVPFMDCTSGALAKYQGFNNDTIVEWIRNGINTIVPSERQYWYTKLQQAYIGNCYSFTLADPTHRRWERDWVQGWYYHATLLDENYAYNIWKEDPATVDRGLRVDIGVESGDSWTVHIKIKNFGEAPEYADLALNVTINGVSDPSQSKYIDKWLKQDGGTYETAETITGTGTLQLKVTLEASNWVSEGKPNIILSKIGDLGSGPPPTYFAYDGVIDAFDYALWKACYDGTAPPNAMYLGDLGSGPPPTYFAYDGVIDAFDYALWKACYDGLGPFE